MQTTSSATAPTVPAAGSAAGGPVVGDRVGLQQLGSQIVGLAGRVASATCRWLLLVAEFDARDGAGAYGLSCTSGWLAYHCGIADRTARDHVRVARALAGFPALAAAMGAGRISYSHARLIAGVATSGEHELVADLLVLAEFGTLHQLESMIAGLRVTDRNVDDPIDPRPATSEQLSFRDRPDGQVGFSGRLAPQRAVVLRAALDAVRAADAADAGDSDAADRDSADSAGQADCVGGGQLDPAGALVRLAELGLAVLAERGDVLPARREDLDTTLVVHLHAVPEPVDLETTVLELAGEDRSGSAGPPRSWRLVPELAVTAARLRAEHDLGAVPDSATGQDRSGSAEPPGPAHRPGPAPGSGPLRALARLADPRGGPGAGLGGDVVARLACSCRVQVVCHGADGSVLDLGFGTRLATPKQVQALIARDGPRCVHPGCRRRHRLHAHHVVFWQNHGPTDLANLVLLCDYHHAAVHRGETTIRVVGRGRFRFTSHGITLPAYADPAAHITTGAPVEDEHDHVVADAAGARWDGTRLESVYAISALAVPRYQARDRRRATQAA